MYVKNKKTKITRICYKTRRTDTYLSLCSGVKLGASLSRSSINIKSFPNPSYFANSIESPSFADRGVLFMRDVVVEEEEMVVLKAFAKGSRTARRRIVDVIRLALSRKSVCRVCCWLEIRVVRLKFVWRRALLHSAAAGY